MRTPFTTIGIIGKPSDPRIAGTLTLIHENLTQAGYRVIVASDSAACLGDSRTASLPAEQLGRQCDLVISVGGDGTFLAAAHAIAGSDVPLLGINLGRLGFLVDISPAELPERLMTALAGCYKEEKRYFLRAKIIRGGELIHEEIALNEVAVHRWVTPSMIEIVTQIDGVFLNSQRSDGLIVSTPTGSTAYALSAGGPILSPSLNALVLVPLNPHTMSNRPIVVDGDAEIELSFCQTKQIKALVTCDHLQIPDVLISDTIVINKDPKPITILHPDDHDFFHTLRKKLNWSNG